MRIETEEATSSTQADLAVRIEDNAHNQSVDRVRFDQLYEEHSQRFNNLLKEARADRAEMRATCEANPTEHRAFTQNIQTLLAEIARLWPRVARCPLATKLNVLRLRSVRCQLIGSRCPMAPTGSLGPVYRSDD